MRNLFRAGITGSLALALPLLVLASFAYAQSDFSAALAGEGSSLTITTVPNAPAPGDVVNLSVESSIIDVSGSTIRWYDNGKIIAQGVGVTSASMTAGALGSRSTIVVALVTPDGESVSAQTTITPQEVDLLVDSDSYTPPFYRGRALPSAGTSLRLQAIPHLLRSNGTAVAPTDITFTWKQDGRVVGSVSGRGRSTAVLPSPTLYGSSDIEVDAISSDGTLMGSASLTLPAQTPSIALYEDNPILGLMYYHELGASTNIPDVQMTFAAMPYFAPIQGPNDPRLSYQWSVNGSTIAPAKTDPSELTLNASDSSGQASIGLNITHAIDIFMSADGTWRVVLGTANGGLSANGSKNPFTGQ